MFYNSPKHKHNFCAIYRGAGGAGDATGDSASEALLVRDLATQVTADAAAAEAAKVAAIAAKVAAETAETNAETAQAAAASSASAASTSATNAASSASAASTSATNASNSATAAAGSASAASTSETNAASSASSASASASTSTTQATNAANSASAAATSATNASNSASAAATSATNASNSATAASGSATSAASSASTATTQAGLASTSASNAATSETNASASASAAATSATNASNSASAASTSATNASNSASAAATSATNAANSASAASTSATNAANSATAAATSASQAEATLSSSLLKANNLSDLTSASTARTNLGLGTAATTNSTAYATASQGTKADTALQPAAIGVSVQAYDADLAAFALKTAPTGDVVGTSDSQTLTNKTINASQLVNASVTADKLSTHAQYMGFKNRIINGAMQIDQRNAGASVTNDSAVNLYPVDRFIIYGNVSSKFTAQQNAGSVTPPNGFRNYLGCTSSSAYTVGAGELFFVQQRVEGYNMADLGWGTASASAVTISFWVRSSLTGTFGGSIQNNDVNRSYPFTYTITAANTWEQKSVTIAGDTSGTWLTTNGLGMRVYFGLGVGSTYSGTAGSWASADYRSATGAVSVVGTNGATFYITGVQLEKGSTATSFDYRPYGTELNLCQRYYLVGPVGACGRWNSATSAEVTYGFPVQMRASPTVTHVGNYLAPELGIASRTITATALSGASNIRGTLLTLTSSGATAGSICGVQNGAAGFSAEL